MINLKSIFCFLDTKVAVGLMLLSHLFPPKRLKKFGNKCYKPSIANAKSSMIKHVNVSIKILKLYIINFIFYFYNNIITCTLYF